MSQEEVTLPEEDVYKGNPMLKLNPGDRFPFQFGCGKALLIIEHFDAIVAFARKHKPDEVIALIGPPEDEQ